MKQTMQRHNILIQSCFCRILSRQTETGQFNSNSEIFIFNHLNWFTSSTEYQVILLCCKRVNSWALNGLMLKDWRETLNEIAVDGAFNQWQILLPTLCNWPSQSKKIWKVFVMLIISLTYKAERIVNYDRYNRTSCVANCESSDVIFKC